jgi:hypothetical protein
MKPYGGIIIGRKEPHWIGQHLLYNHVIQLKDINRQLFQLNHTLKF